jgi:hypothetical protein
MAMLGFLRKRVKKVEIPPNPNEGLFHQVWERKRLPGPGAMNYAYETLALAPFPVAGPSVATRTPLRVTQGQQAYVRHTVGISGAGGTQAGQVMSAPLFDPTLGTGNGLTSPVGLPYNRHGILPAGSVY